MLNTRLEVARSVGLPLIEMEKHLDAAIDKGNQVVSATITGRRAAKLSLDAGQDALEKLAKAQVDLLAARRAIHEAHFELREEQDRMGLGTVSYGDYGDTPREEPKRERGERHLAVAKVA